MANTESEIIASVRLPKNIQRQVKLVSDVLGHSVGKVIRDAIQRHVAALTADPEFRVKTEEFQRRQAETIRELLEPTNDDRSSKRRRT